MDNSFKNEIEFDIQRAFEILNCEIFLEKNILHPLREAAFTQLMIYLRDLAEKLKIAGSRISFDDDVIKSADGKIKDITDLVVFFRNASGHIDSPNHRTENGGVFTFNTEYNKGTFLGRCTNDYEDDVAICTGTQRIYLFRHIHRFFNEAFQWAKANLDTVTEREWEIMEQRKITIHHYEPWYKNKLE